VSFEVTGTLRPPDACHCLQCRKQPGHYWVSTGVSRADLTIHGSQNLIWFRSSEKGDYYDIADGLPPYQH
jgi:hypothetical protein